VRPIVENNVVARVINPRPPLEKFPLLLLLLRDHQSRPSFVMVCLALQLNCISCFSEFFCDSMSTFLMFFHGVLRIPRNLRVSSFEIGNGAGSSNSEILVRRFCEFSGLDPGAGAVLIRRRIF